MAYCSFLNKTSNNAGNVASATHTIPLQGFAYKLICNNTTNTTTFKHLINYGLSSYKKTKIFNYLSF